MAPQAPRADATRAPDLLLYAMTNALSVLIGGHVVEVVAVVHEDVGALVKRQVQKIERGRLVFEYFEEKKQRQI